MENILLDQVLQQVRNREISIEKARELICVLFNVSVSVCETCDWVDLPDKTAICKKCGTTSPF